MPTSAPHNSPQRDRTRPSAHRAAAPAAAESAPRGRAGLLLPALLGSLLLWLAMPPVGCWPLAWLAPVAWLWPARHDRLPGRRPYASLWLASTLYWLVSLYWLVIPLPANSIGWMALSAYLGLYVPVFVGLARFATRQLHWPLALAAPVIWAGQELAQAHLLSGFSMACLSYAPYRCPVVIQIADLGGCYAVGFVIMCGAASLAGALPCREAGWRPWALVPGVLALAATLGYGAFCLAPAKARPGPSIALIQGSIPTEMKFHPAMQSRVYDDYLRLTREALAARPDAELIIWPETMFRWPIVQLPPGAEPLGEFATALDTGRQKLAELSNMFRKAMLLGIDRYSFAADGSPEHFNSSQWVEPDGRLGANYDKRHIVPFGEFFPLAKTFPWLNKLTPLGAGVEAGRSTPAFSLASRQGSTRLAVSICYESTLPHVIREQVRTMADRGDEPDVLVNLSNDGWFNGSCELDQHLACTVLRAVEQRKPTLVAANTGFSASIDACGRILWQGPREAEAWHVADVQIDPRWAASTSLYALWGDAFGGLCLLGCLVLGGVGIGRRWQARRAGRA